MIYPTGTYFASFKLEVSDRCPSQYLQHTASCPGLGYCYLLYCKDISHFDIRQQIEVADLECNVADPEPNIL
jgi:hypothetical protein